MTSGWIEHDGKGMPVDANELVHVRFRDGDTDEHDAPAAAWYWHNESDIRLSNWFHDEEERCGAEIVAYRVVPSQAITPSKEKVETAS